MTVYVQYIIFYCIKMFKTKFQASKGTEVPCASEILYEKIIILAVLHISLIVLNTTDNYH